MTLSPEHMDLVFRKARTQNDWRGKPVGDEQLRALYDLMKWAPSTMNSSPARIVFLRSREAKERLKPALNPGNVDKTMAAQSAARIRRGVQAAVNRYMAEPLITREAVQEWQAMSASAPLPKDDAAR